MENSKVVITSPSLNTKDNVSGIATLTRLVIMFNTEVNYIVFTAGKKDNENRDVKWIFNQFNIFATFKRKIKNIEIVFAHINMPLEKAAIIRDAFFALICRFSKKPYLIHIHGGKYSKDTNTPWIYKAIIKRTLQKASQIIVLGNNEKHFLVNYYKIDEHKINLLPNCVHVPEYKQKKFDNNKCVFLFLGRIDKDKGLEEILQALSSLSTENEYIFNYAGEGPDKDWFLTECKNKLKDKFVYHGVVNGEIKEKLIASSNVFLLPSYFEGLPYALLEAMSYGVVPIVTPVGAIPEVVTNLVNGLIVAPHSSSEIKNAIELLNGNKNDYHQMSINAYRTIFEKYSIVNYVKTLNEIYKVI